MKLIRKWEGCKLVAYQCSAGIWTIGFGTTFYENGRMVKKGDVISKERAEELFMITLDTFIKNVKKNIKQPLTFPQLEALTSLCYNIGCGAFNKSTLVKYINDSRSIEEIEAQWMRWNKVGGKEVVGLTNRRRAEVYLYFGLEYIQK
jgi:lysozyme